MSFNRFPSKIALAANVTVYVKRAGPDILAGIVEEGTAGAWDWKNKTIWIDKTMPLDQQWRTLRHELQHALVDIHEEEHGGIESDGSRLASSSLPEWTSGVPADSVEATPTPQ